MSQRRAPTRCGLPHGVPSRKPEARRFDRLLHTGREHHLQYARPERHLVLAVEHRLPHDARAVRRSTRESEHM